MRFAVRSLAIAALFLFAASAIAQRPDEDARRRQFFEALRNGAAEGEGIGVVPVPRFAAPEPNVPAEGRDGIGKVRIEEAEFAPQGTIQFEVALIHLTSSEEYSQEERNVSGETLDALLQRWKADGKVERMSTFSLSSVNQKQAMVQTGEQVPIITGRTTFGGGRGGQFQSSVSHQDVGTILRVTGRIDGTNVVVECEVEESRLQQGASVPTAAADVADTAASAPGSDAVVHVPVLGRTNVQTTVTVSDGESIILAGGWSKETATTADGERTTSKAVIVTLKATILP